MCRRLGGTPKLRKNLCRVVSGYGSSKYDLKVLNRYSRTPLQLNVRAMKLQHAKELTVSGIPVSHTFQMAVSH